MLLSNVILALANNQKQLTLSNFYKTLYMLGSMFWLQQLRQFYTLPGSNRIPIEKD